MKRILIATLVGAIVAFFWGFLSWAVLPWHKMDTFKDEAAVAQVMIENAPAHGVYVMPQMGEKGANADAITKGPFVYAIVRPNSLDAPWKETTPMLGSFCIQLVGAFIVTLTIHRIRASRYISRASVGPALGLFAGLMMTLPAWNWFELPLSFAFIQILDPFIAWTLAGFAIAAIIKPPRPRRIFS